MQSAKSGVSRALGLPTKLIRMPEAHIRRCHVLTVTETVRCIERRRTYSSRRRVVVYNLSE
jgi:hypothetical protein